tara:strand:- start:618 stop:1130 length:513 start_codon:yes stop_codon:yes gene_type:complete
MKSVKNIVFLGMMGSGKTTIGSLVSKKLNLNFFDIDEYIETKIGEKISKIFDKKGEKYFRDIEEKATLEILKKKNIVIALGGGAFINANIRREVLKNHISFWLKLDDKTILKRITKNSKRPIAYNLSADKLVELIKKRTEIYSKALYNIKCDNMSKTDIVKKVINIYENF